MKAVVKDVNKGEHPRTDNVSGAAVSTLVVEVEVDYLNDAGDLHSTQRYAFLPEELQDLERFDRQARAMQIEIDEAVKTAQTKGELVATHRPVDDKVEQLRQHFHLKLGDELPINDHR